jgi:hypothetical protein
LTLLELLHAVGVVPVRVQRKLNLNWHDLNLYKGLGRLLKAMEGMVETTRVSAKGRATACATTSPTLVRRGWSRSSPPEELPAAARRQGKPMKERP